MNERQKVHRFAELLDLNISSAQMDRSMNLLVNQIKNAIRRMLEERKVDASVVDKVNARGELVVAIVLNEVCPACDGTGKKRYPVREGEEPAE